VVHVTVNAARAPTEQRLASKAHAIVAVPIVRTARRKTVPL